MLKNLMVVAAATLISTTAFAAVTPTQSFTLSQTNESFSRVFSFAQFDSLLGTLTSINFSLDVASTGRGMVTNNSVMSGQYGYTASSELSLTDSLGNITYDEATTKSSATFTLGPTQSQSALLSYPAEGNTVYTGSGVGTFILYSSNSGNGSPNGSIDSAAFIGNGVLSLKFDGDDQGSCTGASVGCTSSAMAGGTVSLFYGYTLPDAAVATVPEPASWALLVIGVIGIGATRRSTAVAGHAGR